MLENIIGIVAEYNPFHNGHLYMLQAAKAKFKDAACVIVLSSNFTQRGDPALLDKFARAEMALANGADLVLELPFFFSCAAAQDFSSGAIDILAGLKLVNYIAFGLEDFNYANLDELINILIQEPDEFKNNLKINLAQGMSYTRAASRALNKIIPDSEEFLLQPNNLLAISYLKRIKERDYNLKPLFIPRVGSAHGEKIFANNSEGAARNFFAEAQGQDKKFFVDDSECAAKNFFAKAQGQDEKIFVNDSECAAKIFFAKAQGQDEKFFVNDSEGAERNFSSSSAIREAIKINSLKILNNYMPEASLKIFERESL
ncbi:MAG: nucleotidyltransferase family protein, partial [Synergistaceae bacterium]|nr:nucleotidyltransferase family protein [Synergistaceae bacterium]